MSKYIKVEVTRMEGTEVYLKVPDDFNIKDLKDELLLSAVKETIKEIDWDKYGWEETLEAQSYSEVTEDVAIDYRYFDTEKVK